MVAMVRASESTVSLAPFEHLTNAIFLMNGRIKDTFVFIVMCYKGFIVHHVTHRRDRDREGLCCISWTEGINFTAETPRSKHSWLCVIRPNLQRRARARSALLLCAMSQVFLVYSYRTMLCVVVRISNFHNKLCTMHTIETTSSRVISVCVSVCVRMAECLLLSDNFQSTIVCAYVFVLALSFFPSILNEDEKSHMRASSN